LKKKKQNKSKRMVSRGFCKTINEKPAVLMKEEPTMNWRFYALLFGF
jgi:hypothetical protein